MDFIKNNWILLLILTLGIIILYKFLTRYNVKTVTTVVDGVKTTVPVYNIRLNDKNAPVTITPSNTQNVELFNFSIGDKLYASTSGANTYKLPGAFSSNLVKFYPYSSYIGTYLGMEGSFVKVIVETKVFSSVLDPFNFFSSVRNETLYVQKGNVFKIK